MGYNPLVSSVHRILQTRILEWVFISSSRGSSRSRDWTWVSCIADGFFTEWAPKFFNFKFEISVTGKLKLQKLIKLHCVQKFFKDSISPVSTSQLLTSHFLLNLLQRLLSFLCPRTILSVIRDGSLAKLDLSTTFDNSCLMETFFPLTMGH